MIRCPHGIGIDSWNRMEVVLDNRKHMEHDAWLIQLGDSWPTCDQIRVHRDELVAALERLDRRQLDLLMSGDEQSAHRALPDLIQVWRGCYEFNRDGLSWSLSRDIAEGFTRLNRYHQPGLDPVLLNRWVRREEIALKLDRQEQEVIAHTVYETETLAAAIGGAV